MEKDGGVRTDRLVIAQNVTVSNGFSVGGTTTFALIVSVEVCFSATQRAASMTTVFFPRSPRFCLFSAGFVSFVLAETHYRCNKLSPDAYLNTLSISKEAKIERY